jgi:hypothetical protein
MVGSILLERQKKIFNFGHNVTKISGTLREDLIIRVSRLVISGIVVGIDVIDKVSNPFYSVSFLCVIFMMRNQGTKACRRNA